MKPALPLPPSASSRSSHSCIRCSERKVRCDRQKPCNACIKHKVQCVFRPSQLAQKRHRHATADRLRNRLKRDEVNLQEQGVEPDQLPSASENERYRNPDHVEATVAERGSQLPTPSSITFESERFITKTQLLHDRERSKFVDNGLWSRVVEELRHPKEALEESHEVSDVGASDDEFNLVLGVISKPDSRYPSPSAEHIHDLWQIFVDNVDPLTKVVHVPTLHRALQEATTNIERVSRGFEALMYAIYSAAVMSLRDDDCERRFGEPRKLLLSHYTTATKVALSRAKFMETSSIIVLQALVLHVISVRDFYQPRAVWTLTGVALRIAEGMGLHRDGTSLGLPPFETEIRRRIWWLLKMHDIRTADLTGLPKFRNLDVDNHTPKLPAYINDHELYVGMPSPPIESTRPTDMIFCVLRTELIATHAAKFRKQGNDNWIWDGHASEDDMLQKEEAMREVEDILETKYLRYCDPSQPLQLMALLHTRSAMNVGRFITHHPRRWVNASQTPESERQYVWHISINLLEQYDMMQSNLKISRFAWHAAYFLPWHAFIHVLDALRAKPLMVDAVKAWQLIEVTYDNNPDMLSNVRKIIYVAVGNLCLKAYDAREVALGDSSTQHTPMYITKLRQLRQIVNTAEMKVRDERNKNAEAEVNPVYDTTIPNMPDFTTALARNSFEPHCPQNNTSAPSTKVSDQASLLPTEGEAFWATSDFNGDVLVSDSGTMNVDVDFMLSQDHSLADTSGQTVDWTQWDAWLRDLN